MVLNQRNLFLQRRFDLTISDFSIVLRGQILIEFIDYMCLFSMIILSRRRSSLCYILVLASPYIPFTYSLSNGSLPAFLGEPVNAFHFLLAFLGRPIALLEQSSSLLLAFQRYSVGLLAVFQRLSSSVPREHYQLSSQCLQRILLSFLAFLGRLLADQRFLAAFCRFAGGFPAAFLEGVLF